MGFYGQSFFVSVNDSLRRECVDNIFFIISYFHMQCEQNTIMYLYTGIDLKIDNLSINNWIMMDYWDQEGNVGCTILQINENT